jgi:tetratricopeptide (TPR) repeat protein
MASLLRLLVLCLLFGLALPAAASNTLSKDDLATQKELLQLKIDSNREIVQKDLDNLKSRIDALDSRINDQNNRVGDIGQSVERTALIIGILGTLVTVILAFGGLIGYFSVAKKAVEEAQTASKKWFDDHHEELVKQIRDLEKATEQAHQKIDNSVNDVQQHSDAASATIERMQKNLNTPDEQARPISDSEQDNLRQSVEQIRGKPEASYSFEDWNTRAFEAYNSKQYEDAALYWKHASSTPHAGAKNTAQALFNRGISLSLLNRHDEACTTYKQLIETFSLDSAPIIRVIVASAMSNMGITLGRMQKPVEAIAIDEKLIATYSSDTNPAIREQVANAYNGKGFVRLMEAKKAWNNKDQALSLLHEAQADLLASLELHANSGIALGNLAYVQWLLGNQQDAKEHFCTALSAAQHGAEELYRGTLNDVVTDATPEDAAFRDMIERLWNEYQAAKSSEG